MESPTDRGRCFRVTRIIFCPEAVHEEKERESVTGVIRSLIFTATRRACVRGRESKVNEGQGGRTRGMGDEPVIYGTSFDILRV